jgi:hypothetical protein
MSSSEISSEPAPVHLNINSAWGYSKPLQCEVKTPNLDVKVSYSHMITSSSFNHDNGSYVLSRPMESKSGHYHSSFGPLVDMYIQWSWKDHQKSANLIDHIVVVGDDGFYIQYSNPEKIFVSKDRNYCRLLFSMGDMYMGKQLQIVLMNLKTRMVYHSLFFTLEKHQQPCDICAICLDDLRKYPCDVYPCGHFSHQGCSWNYLSRGSLNSILDPTDKKLICFYCKKELFLNNNKIL